MNIVLLFLSAVLLVGSLLQPTHAQTIQLGEVLLVRTPALKNDADANAFETAVIQEMLPAWQALGDQAETHFFRADRTSPTSPTPVGTYWMVWSIDTRVQAKALLSDTPASGFLPEVLDKVGRRGVLPTRFVSDPGTYTEYELIAEVEALPEVALLGAHFTQVRPDRTVAFEAFVRETLQPALVDHMPGMDLLYYKAVRGADTGQYLTLFAIESVEARARYWPTDSSETGALMEAFTPMRAIAQELEGYLVEGSYVHPETGAAASVFESLVWTDFAFLK